MIKFQNVTKTYNFHTTVLDDVSFSIKKGEFVSIVGKSGAGKTTLIKLLLGIEKPTSGEIFFDNNNVGEMTPGQLQKLRRRIGVVYQDYKLLPMKTVYENISYVMAVKGRTDEEIAKEAKQILDITGLSEKEENFPEELSGGEQQRLAVARAIACQPEVIIADEPTGNLDPYNAYEIIYILQKLNKMGKTIILSSHDKDITNKLGRRVITLEDGAVIRDEEKGRFII